MAKRTEWAKALQRQQHAVAAWQLAEAAYSPGAPELTTAINAVMEADAALIDVPAPDVIAFTAKIEAALRPEYARVPTADQ